MSKTREGVNNLKVFIWSGPKRKSQLLQEFSVRNTVFCNCGAQTWTRLVRISRCCMNNRMLAVNWLILACLLLDLRKFYKDLLNPASGFSEISCLHLIPMTCLNKHATFLPLQDHTLKRQWPVGRRLQRKQVLLWISKQVCLLAKKAPPPSPKALYEPIGNHHPSAANEVIVTHLASKQLALSPRPPPPGNLLMVYLLKANIMPWPRVPQKPTRRPSTVSKSKEPYSFSGSNLNSPCVQYIGTSRKPRPQLEWGRGWAGGFLRFRTPGWLTFV